MTWRIAAKNQMHTLSNSAAVCDSHPIAIQFIKRVAANLWKLTAHTMKETNFHRFVLTRKKDAGLL